MTTANRDALLKLTALLRPALSTQTFIPALTHILFDDGFATAYNDVTAVVVKSPVDLEICVPGELFIKALSSFNADEVLIQEGAGTNPLLLTSGRSKLKMPTLPVSAFPLKMPKGEAVVVELTDGILDGIRKCLFSVGADPTHPAQMGVTLDTDGGYAVLYSTDNFTISRCKTTSKVKLPADSPIILPTFFCDQLLSLAKAFKDDDVDLHVYPGALVATFGKKAKLLTKTVVDLEPLDFPKIIGKHLDVAKVKAVLKPVPTSFDAAWNRALLVLAAEADKATLVSPQNGRIVLDSKSSLGQADDELEWSGEGNRGDFHVDPTMVVRAAKICGSLAFYDRVMVLASDDASFIHLIAHCSA